MKASVRLLFVLTAVLLSFSLFSCKKKDTSELTDTEQGLDTSEEDVPHFTDDSILDSGLPTSYSDGDGPGNAEQDKDTEEDSWDDYFSEDDFFDDSYGETESETEETGKTGETGEQPVEYGYEDIVGTWDLISAEIDKAECIPDNKDAYVTFNADGTADYMTVAINGNKAVLLEGLETAYVEASEYDDYIMIDTDSLEYERYFILKSDNTLMSMFIVNSKDWKMPREFVGIYARREAEQ